MLPSVRDRLNLVPTWGEVSDRSVLPFGIRNPVPLYHWLLYAFLQVLPVAEWSLRLPSLLAGLGCIAAVYVLCRRLLGTQVALVAALLVALDPMQAEVSVMARPYALGALACVLSFLALLGILYSRSTAGRVTAAVGYGLTLALQGYFNPVLLLVCVGHVGMMIYWWLGRPYEEAGSSADEEPNPAPWAFEKAPPRSIAPLLCWLAGCALAVVLLLPEVGYLQEVHAFTSQNQEYLTLLLRPQLTTILKHNSTFLVALLAISAAGYALRQMNAPSADDAPEVGATETKGEAAAGVGTPGEAVTNAAPEAAKEPAEVPAKKEEVPPPPAPAENPDLVWVGRCWLFLPQMAAVLLAFGLGQQVLLSRYLTYVELGGLILLAYWATRERLKDVRLGVVAVAALALIVMWFRPSWSLGTGLTTSVEGALLPGHIRTLEDARKWEDGDVLLYRAGFLEGDLLPDRVPEANRQHLEAVLAAPLTTLYVGNQEHPYILLSYSNRRGKEFHSTAGGLKYEPERFYTEKLAQKVAGYTKYWVATGQGNRQAFLACLIPWLANTQDCWVSVARERPGAEHYLFVPPGVGPEDQVPGLSNEVLTSDFPSITAVRRIAPRACLTILGVGGALMGPNAHVTVPVELRVQENGLFPPLPN
jgi:hypothetical protein